VLASTVFVFIHFNSMAKFGWKNHLRSFAPDLDMPIAMKIAMSFMLWPIEFLGLIIKCFVLAVRLFANMLAGHIIIICLISLIFIFGGLSKIAGWGFAPFSVAFTVFIYFIEILVAFLQAYIFANLTAVFIGQSFEGGHDDVAHHQDALVV
jgi:F-type H+-transporting ATPase subunit a